MIDTSAFQGKTAVYYTLGCKLNFSETSTFGQMLQDMGVRTVEKGEKADICLINTCSVTEVADSKCRQAIRKMVKQNPGAFVVVTGCYAQLEAETVAKIEGVNLVLGSNEKANLIDYLSNAWSGTNQKSDDNIAEYHAVKTKEIKTFQHSCSRGNRTRYFLKVQDGCNYFCSYCTIPLARGKSRNPSIESLVEEAKEAISGGAKEIILSGVNIGDFGRSTNEHFIDLLRALDGIEGDFRIRISSCEPNLLSDEIIDFVAASRHFAPHFHIPLQSGSNTVLKIMGRRYTRELFAERVAHIKTVMPHAFIGVDCMVGVRGETEECWAEYVDFINSLDVSQLHVFTYSERANTRMLDMDLIVVPQRERERRSKQLHAISAAKTEAFYRAHEGYEATVLWEAKKADGLMYGFTENYIKVSCPYDKAKVNTFERITVPRPDSADIPTGTPA